MHIPRYARAILIGIGILIVASVVIWRSQRVDPDLQQAYDELVKLRSACQVGLTYADFSSRLVNAKVNVDVDLARSSDKGDMVGFAFDAAFRRYQLARDNWLSDPDGVGASLAKASEAVDRVKLYISVNEVGRMKLLSDENKVQETRDRISREQLEKEEKMQREEEARQQKDLEADRNRLAQEEKLEASKKAALEPMREVERQQRADADKQRADADKQNAERERKRRFAPDGIVYNLKPLRLAAGKKTTLAAAGSELTLVRKNLDGTVHVQFNGAEVDMSSDDVTNDRDWLKAYQKMHPESAIGRKTRASGDVINYASPEPTPYY